MKNDTCIICGNKFEYPREGKLYCSDSCKSSAYINRKKEDKPNEKPELKPEPEKKVLYLFYHKEYEKEIGRAHV